MSLHMFAVTIPGLEPLTAAELHALGASGVAVTGGGVNFSGPPELLWRANLELRTATRVLLRVGAVDASSLDALRRNATAVPWARLVGPIGDLRIAATCHASRIYHTGAAAQRVEAAIRETSATVQGAPPVTVVARIHKDRCTLSVDSSGEPLHRRGWRQETAKAPLRETLAAAVLAFAGWTGDRPLIDPLCGSGTIAIEAALLAMRRPPGAGRSFAFMGWPGFDAARWEALRGASLDLSLDAPPFPIQASDRDAGAVEATRRNAERAGVAAHVHIDARAVSAVEPSAPAGLVACNPPYGGRMGGPDLRNLYAALGNLLRGPLLGYGLALLTTDRKLATATGLRIVSESAPWPHGGLRVRAYSFGALGVDLHPAR